jgi:hypothetical protein
MSQNYFLSFVVSVGPATYPSDLTRVHEVTLRSTSLEAMYAHTQDEYGISGTDIHIIGY